ncbi:hypothetical protein [Microvirga solisilvae]|uniref:hypothetical protein n=1 Tax=Microvirga solisilvae TaxID=2919498 RepID=UPI001FAE9C0B|nr:hypothetical protein [Microvirga solisilvae]
MIVARRHQTRCAFIIPLLALGFGSGLAACSASADVVYGEYRFGPGYQSGRVYENRVYADTGRGVGRENCRTGVRQQVDPLGRATSSEETICN